MHVLPMSYAIPSMYVLYYNSVVLGSACQASPRLSPVSEAEMTLAPLFLLVFQGSCTML